MNLKNIALPAPDWQTILVYSDYLEDHDNLNDANALRWLYKWDHWPYTNHHHPIGWWVADSYTQSDMAVSRYGKCSCSIEYATPSLAQATLPPEYKNLTPYFHDFNTLEEALLDFFLAYSEVGDITPKIYTPSDYPDLPHSLSSLLVEGTRRE